MLQQNLEWKFALNEAPILFHVYFLNTQEYISTHLINVLSCLLQIHGGKVLAEFHFAQNFVKGNSGVYFHVSSETPQDLLMF